MTSIVVVYQNVGQNVARHCSYTIVTFLSEYNDAFGQPLFKFGETKSASVCKASLDMLWFVEIFTNTSEKVTVKK